MRLACPSLLRNCRFISLHPSSTCESPTEMKRDSGSCRNKLISTPVVEKKQPWSARSLYSEAAFLLLMCGAPAKSLGHLRRARLSSPHIVANQGVSMSNVKPTVCYDQVRPMRSVTLSHLEDADHLAFFSRGTH